MKGGWRAQLYILPAIATYFICDQKLLSIRNAEGRSMEPTIKHGDIIFVDKLLYKWNGLRKGDIVVAIQPIDPSVSICKRIVEVSGGVMQYGGGLTVPEDCFWLEGDNKDHSHDSRNHGPVGANLIKGKVFFHISV